MLRKYSSAIDYYAFTDTFLKCEKRLVTFLSLGNAYLNNIFSRLAPLPSTTVASAARMSPAIQTTSLGLDNHDASAARKSTA